MARCGQLADSRRSFDACGFAAFVGRSRNDHEKKTGHHELAHQRVQQAKSIAGWR